jgi:hypothetical protein
MLANDIHNVDVINIDTSNVHFIKKKIAIIFIFRRCGPLWGDDYQEIGPYSTATDIKLIVI